MGTEKKYEFTADELSALIKNAVSEALAGNRNTILFCVDGDDEVDATDKMWVDYVPLPEEQIKISGLKNIPRVGDGLDLYGLTLLEGVNVSTYSGEKIPTLTRYSLSLREFKVVDVTHTNLQFCDSTKNEEVAVVLLVTERYEPASAENIISFEKETGEQVDLKKFEDVIDYLDEIAEQRKKGLF